MDIEFHYYFTYLIAARAGFDPISSYIVAYSSQFVDDNVIIYEISPGTSEYYSNYISQTVDILKPARKLFRIYPLFHFIPGTLLKGDHRKDGKLHYLNTTPDSINSRKILHAALDTNDLYRIGIACHAYADTWAHQNFTGYFDEFNVLKEPLERPWILFSYLGVPIGHVSARHSPDKVNECWEDCRLLLTYRNNNEIFLEAIGKMFEELYKHNYPSSNGEDLFREKEELMTDLRAAMEIKNKEKRINNYKALSRKKAYGGEELKNYESKEWMNNAISEDLRKIRIRGKHVIIKFILTYISSNITILNTFTWGDQEKYKRTHWFKFQEAVKKHQEKTTEILNETIISELKLNNW